MEKRSPASGNESAQRPTINVRRISLATLRNALSLMRCAQVKTAVPIRFMAPLLFVGVLSLGFTFSLPGNKKVPKAEHIRKAAVAGGFYPGDKATLGKYVDELLRQANPPEIKAPIRAMMVPHAGYVFSGSVAANAYKELEGRDIRTVILIGNSHRHFFDGIAIDSQGAFETPLGLVPIDESLTGKLLAADPAIADRPDIHEGDHVLEVQLPFLQRVLRDFKIVPILFSGDSPELARKLAGILLPFLDDNTVIIASTDMSHYPPYAEASIADRKTLNAILTGKMEALDTTLQTLAAEHIPQEETFLCSPSGVRVALILAQSSKNLEPVLLKYANSGDVPAGEKNRVVGYGAVAFIAKQNTAPATPLASDKKKELGKDEKILDPQEENELLRIARATVESYVRNGILPAVETPAGNLQRPLGAFVTLKEKGQLRGCIGRFEASDPLYKIVQQMAVAAATQDPRFKPVSSQELDLLEYEISVLSPLRKISSPDEIVIGKHGVTVSEGFHHGVFLPQVATETGWSKEQFLSELCSQKAGLPGDCWKDPKVHWQVFTAEVFSEKK